MFLIYQKALENTLNVFMECLLHFRRVKFMCCVKANAKLMQRQYKQRVLTDSICQQLVKIKPARWKRYCFLIF